MVRDIFRASSDNPTNAIHLDIETRQRYANAPFCLDDRSESMVSILSQIFRGPKWGITNTPSSNCPAKKLIVACYNWNLGICDDLCPGWRRHGLCSECGDAHRVKDISGCYLAFQACHGKGARVGASEGGGSSGILTKTN